MCCDSIICNKVSNTMKSHPVMITNTSQTHKIAVLLELEHGMQIADQGRYFETIKTTFSDQILQKMHSQL